MANAWMVAPRGSDEVFYWHRKDAEQAFLADCRVKSWDEFWASEWLFENTYGNLSEGYLSVEDGPRLTAIEIQDSFRGR